MMTDDKALCSQDVLKVNSSPRPLPFPRCPLARTGAERQPVLEMFDDGFDFL